MQHVQLDWAFRTTPQAELDNVVIPVPRGKALGGSSAINSMAHVRAHRSSYDAWEKAGATGWNYDTLLPSLKRSERAPGMDPRWRGTDGPMQVAPGPAAQPGSFYHACYQAAEQAGAPATADGNGEQAEGIAHTELNIVNLTRQSAADAYLGPASDRQNLTVVTGAFARRLVVDGGRCTGVEYAVDGKTRTARAGREVVLAAGVIGSAQSLLVSGIGPAGQLRRLGIEVVHDLPGVGQNLQDHPFAHVSFTAKEPLDVEPWGSSAWRPERTDGYSVIVSLQRPRSRGTLTLASPDPAVAPLIDPGYYTDPRDLDLMVTALRRAREMATRTRCTRGGPASLPPAAS